MMKILKCKICGNEYKSKNTKTLYCSEKCRDIGNRGRPKRKQTKRQTKRQTHKISKDYLIFQRDNFTCIYCGKNSIEDNIKLTFDHVIPFSKGGRDIVSNIITSCDICNRIKNNKILNPDLLTKILNVIELRNDKIKSRLIEIDLYLKSKYKYRSKYR